MTKRPARRKPSSRLVAHRPRPTRAPTGISGLDELTGGGLPAGRTTLIRGGPGTGKTILAIQFLRHGAWELGEPGILVSCLESSARLIQNASLIDWEFGRLVADGELAIIDASPEIVPTPSGEFDLGGIKARIDHLIETRGVTRLAIDAPEMLLALYGDRRREVQELSELYRWMADRHLTAVITSLGADDGGATPRFQEQAADCLISLDQWPGPGQVAVRMLSVVKFRGAACDPIAAPFVITAKGIALREEDGDQQLRAA
jgi:circadian clock protein KaiC